MSEIKHILCPVDLSQESEITLKTAFTIASSFHAKLSVCFCGAGSSNGADGEVRRKIDEMIINISGFLENGETEKPKIECGSCEAENDTVVRSILAEVGSRAADLIVLSAHYQQWKHALPRAIAENVCRAASCPVMIVHPEGSDGEMPLIRKILVAQDFSDDSELALQYAAAFARKNNAELHLLHVITEPFDREKAAIWSAFSGESLYHNSYERLHKSLPAENGNSFKVSISVLWGKPYREILSYVREHQTDLIVMGAHGADFGQASLFGSNADRVLRQAKCSVLIARPLKPTVF